MSRAPQRVGIERFRYFMTLWTEEIMLARRRSRAPGRVERGRRLADCVNEVERRPVKDSIRADDDGKEALGF
jgi:hypothetical protein